MTEKEYLSYFESIAETPEKKQQAPYNDAQYLNYTKLNSSRMHRWLKTQTVAAPLQTVLKQITKPQHWIVITEPWCGDAAHSVPFILMAAKQNPLIKLTIELRDSEPNRINQYLTNGGKSIPKLIIKDADDNDLAVWGPRPKACQAIYDDLKANNASFDEIVVGIQNWYNTDKGTAIQTELLEIIKQTM